MGYRNAMTYQEMQLYQAQMAQRQAQMQSITQSLQQLNQNLNVTTQQMYQQSYQYQAPQVQSWSPYNNSQTTSYFNAGNSWISSNGGSCQMVGSNVVCSDGSHCVRAGQALICN